VSGKHLEKSKRHDACLFRSQQAPAISSYDSVQFPRALDRFVGNGRDTFQEEIQPPFPIAFATYVVETTVMLADVF
jgi:hypothetical protein